METNIQTWHKNKPKRRSLLTSNSILTNKNKDKLSSWTRLRCKTHNCDSHCIKKEKNKTKQTVRNPREKHHENTQKRKNVPGNNDKDTARE